jgi:hypothetical protein
MPAPIKFIGTLKTRLKARRYMFKFKGAPTRVSVLPSPFPIKSIGTQTACHLPPVFVMNIKTKDLRAHIVLRISN